MPRSLRTARSVGLALVLSLSLAACGDKGAPSPADGGGSKPSATEEAKKAALTRENFADRVFGAVVKSGTAKVRFETTSAGKTTSGHGEVKYGDQLALRMEMGAPGGEGGQEVLLIGDTFYVGMGEKYMSMSLDAMKSQGMPDITTKLDPTFQAQAFEKALTTFEQKGAAETIDGVKATPYAITLDPQKAPEIFGTEVDSLEPLSFTYHVGPDDLLRKMTLTGKNGTFSATYTDWGAPVDIEAPPADKVMKGMS